MRHTNTVQHCLKSLPYCKPRAKGACGQVTAPPAPSWPHRHMLLLLLQVERVGKASVLMCFRLSYNSGVV